ncbi:MAG: hypothetical protein A4S09_07805 [Proteobacteria bacterium SG_bin7]|nr:MAG: hypothetical protein A4S09_07805 [Proteobacteria bacterium SG_bin7]
MIRQRFELEIDAVIPTYNRAETLSRAISSIVAQTYPVKNIWVIDDGSTDMTFEAVAEFEDQVQYVKTANLGVSHARNLGVGLSTSKWVAFLDSDDEWLPQKLEKQVEILRENPDLKLIHGEEIWIRNGVRVNQHKKHTKSGGNIFEKSLALCLISPSATLIRKETLLSLGGFREDYPVCEDYDMWLKFCSQYPVGFVSTPIIKKYGGHNDQLSRKYFAMDYWRVKSLNSCLHLPHITNSMKRKIQRLIVAKSEILLNGYQKHNNTRDMDEIEKIYKSVAFLTR